MSSERYKKVTGVLAWVLVLNVGVAAAKIAFGYLSGTVSILSDGFHSLTDGLSNVVALVGIRAASRPADDNHPYGHRKYETLAAIAIVAFLAIVVVEIGRAAFAQLQAGTRPTITAMSFGVMIVTLAVNVFVARYERRAGRRLASELLIADAMHTQSDVLTSMAVIAALAGSALGVPFLDPLAAAIVAVFIARAAFEIARSAARILSDEMVIAEADIRSVVMDVPGVLGCHHIRTRGSADHVFLDLHVWTAGETPLDAAHRLSHDVKDRLMERYPQIGDAVIHIEPPPRHG